MINAAIFISGGGSNMAAIVREQQAGILKNTLKTTLIFSNNPDAYGINRPEVSGIPIKVINSKGLKRSTFEKKLCKLLDQYQIDYIILAGYMKIISSDFIAKYPNKIINIHPADTKAYQGPAGYEWAFNHKLSETKITIHYVDAGIDTGAIIAQKSVDLTGCNKLEEVKKRGLAIEHQFYPEILNKLFID